MSDRAFVFAVCGAASHIRTLHRALEYLRPRTQLPIVVVTESRRNEIAIDHTDVIEAATPAHFDNHQASIFLKTSLHRLLPGDRVHAYIDTDVLAVDDHADTIFDHLAGPVTFARDLTRLENRVSTFSPWAVNCACPTDTGQPCLHLAQAIEAKFGARVPDDWVHWNGGVFLIGREAGTFMETWHRFTMQVFDDPYWKTRDQGTMIATVWSLGLQHQACLPPAYNFIVDDHNADLRFDRDAGYSLHESIPGIHPHLLHLYHAPLDRPDWTLARDVEEVLASRTRAARAAVQTPPALPIIAARVARRASPAPHAVSGSPLGSEPAKPADYRVIVGQPHFDGGFSAELVRGLAQHGVDAHVLMTEEGTDRVTHAGSVQQPPVDVRLATLPVSRDASWGARWGALVRYLEEQAPCVYVPLLDWRHSNVSPLLSGRVAVVGTVTSDDPRLLDEVDRLGRYWNAVVSPDAQTSARIGALAPELRDRIVEIPPRDDDAIARYVSLIGRAAGECVREAFHRPRGMLQKPPYQVADEEVFGIHYARGVEGVGVFPSYRADYEDFGRAVGESRTLRIPAWRPEIVQSYPIIIATSGATISSVVAAVAEELLRYDQPVRVVHDAAVTPRHSLVNVPVVPMPDRTLLRLRRGQPLVAYVEQHAPCIYLADAAWPREPVCSRLSNGVGVVGRVDDASPAALARAVQMARAWDAVVAGSEHIAASLASLDPALEERLVTIPAPIDAPDHLPSGPLVWGAPLRIACLGARSPDGPPVDLRSVTAMLAEHGVPFTLRVVSDGDGAAVFDGCDVLVVTTASETTERRIREAMGRGCVPMLVGAVSDSVRDTDNGYVLSAADVSGVARRLAALQDNIALRRLVAVRAFETFDTFKQRGPDVASSYSLVFDRVFRDLEAGRYRRGS